MSHWLGHAWVFGACALSAFACTARRPGGEPALRPNYDEATVDATTARSRALSSHEDVDGAQGVSIDRSATEASGVGEGWLVVDTPAVLEALEASGASLGEMLGGTPGPLDNGALVALPRYASLVRILDADVGEIARADPNAGVSVARSSHRLFDVRWLRSPAARFELVGVVNRLDRAGII